MSFNHTLKKLPFVVFAIIIGSIFIGFGFLINKSKKYMETTAIMNDVKYKLNHNGKYDILMNMVYNVNGKQQIYSNYRMKTVNTLHRAMSYVILYQGKKKTIYYKINQPFSIELINPEKAAYIIFFIISVLVYMTGLFLLGIGLYEDFRIRKSKK